MGQANGAGFLDDFVENALYDILEVKQKGLVQFISDRAERDENMYNNSAKLLKAARDKGIEKKKNTELPHFTIHQ